MSRCVGCEFVLHEQFKGYCGRWLCFHPYRRELSNRGTFTYPGNDNPRITVCETSVADYNNSKRHREVLAASKTPVWCYFEAVERAKKKQPGFDPDAQRAVLWPEKEEKFEYETA